MALRLSRRDLDTWPGCDTVYLHTSIHSALQLLFFSEDLGQCLNTELLGWQSRSVVLNGRRRFQDSSPHMI